MTTAARYAVATRASAMAAAGYRALGANEEQQGEEKLTVRHAR